MKIDRVLTTEDSQLEDSRAAIEAPGAVKGHPGDGDGGGRGSHDLRAALAIVNGFCAALDANFQDLSDQYNAMLEADDARKEEFADRLMTLDADCRFCLARLDSSIGDLKQRLQAKHAILGANEPKGADS